MRHSVRTLLCFLCLFACPALLVQAAGADPVWSVQPDARPAPPEAATLYPNAARLFVVQSLAVRDGMIRFVLPANTMLESLRLHVEEREIQIAGISPLPRTATSSPELQRLRVEHEHALAVERDVSGRLAAVQARRKLWDAPAIRFTQAVEFERMDALMAKRLAALRVEESTLQESLERAAAERQRLESAVQNAGAEERELLLVSVAVTPANPGMVKASLNYVLSGCGWDSAYRLEALPGGVPARGADARQDQGGIVRFEHRAIVRQSSGMDWKNIRLTLASDDPGGDLAPRPNRPWRIEPNRPAAKPMRAKGGPSLLSEETGLDMAESFAAPVREQAAFTAWEAGERDVPAGSPMSFTLKREDWPASFVRLIRPAVDSRAYLTATITLTEQRHLPDGHAAYFMEGELAGTRSFCMTGDKADISFGADPRVNAVMTLDVGQSGRKGIIDRRRTRVWNWSIEVSNAHTRPVTVRVEDPQPQSRDEAITIETASTPAPKEENQTFVWTLELPGGGKQTLKHGVTMSAPEEMNVSEGR